ncbi:hypothetical protein JMA_33440 [Jeotgalibacillus malaysiensis]|uniref:Uncharacterized protein n=1 Tax=Jeotgalibacillus malaysiensis TaxID=1508404 RepID=A0A0B5ARE7_9BACL|nr:hypothetical protein JMA_33440 [Jeotgalibacillus malaysiensis]
MHLNDGIPSQIEGIITFLKQLKESCLKLSESFSILKHKSSN